MSRHISFWVLLALVVGIGFFLFQIVQPFLLPLFLALVLALLAWPLFERMTVICRGRKRMAALFTTIGIVLLVVVPVTTVLVITGQRLLEIADGAIPTMQREAFGSRSQQVASMRDKLSPADYTAFRSNMLSGKSPTEAIPVSADRSAKEAAAELEQNISTDEIRQQMQIGTNQDIESPANSPWLEQLKKKVSPYVPAGALDNLERSVASGTNSLLRNIYEKTTSFMASLVTVVVGFAIMTFALYYFFADGHRFAEKCKTLLPLDAQDEMSLYRRFDDICRGVVIGTFAAALTQAILLSLGLAVAGVPYVWLLSILALVAAMIPVLGSGVIYVPAAAYLYLQQHYVAATLLLVYGGGVVSTSDNLVRAYVLQGRSKLHPLIGLVSMLGGLQLIGLWGIFIGPIVAGFFYGLLKILHEKLEQDEQRKKQEQDAKPAPRSVASGTAVPSV